MLPPGGLISRHSLTQACSSVIVGSGLGRTTGQVSQLV